MKYHIQAGKQFRADFIIVTIILLLFGISHFSVQAQTKTLNSGAAQKSKPVKFRARGTFDVKIIPSPAVGENVDFVRLSLEKQFHGELEGSSKVEMLTIDTGNKTSGGYVAIEKISGTLNGRRGSFALQHSGTMIGGKMELSIIVVPESGTGELTGLTGRMTIVIENQKHSFDFQYTLPPMAESKSHKEKQK